MVVVLVVSVAIVLFMVLVMLMVEVMMAMVMVVLVVGKKAFPSKLCLHTSFPLLQGANHACTSRESVQITISQSKNTLLRSRFRAIRLP